MDLRPVARVGRLLEGCGLRWGDVVEIPEAEHPLNEKWPGFSTTELANLKKCLTRQVEIVVKGQATTHHAGAQDFRASRQPFPGGPAP